MLPALFLERMEKMLGEEFPEFLNSYDHERYQALRINALKKNEKGDIANLENLFHLSEVPWAKYGFYYEKEDQPGKHPFHEAGVYYIQEPSAMAPVGMLEVEPGEKILDLCAAPGGKSTQIAALMQGKGLLVTNEIHPARAKILSENVERMGIVNACVTNETPQRLSEFFPDYFDRILVDAPCSGEGMFRKNEEATEQWSPENVELCAQRQQEILDCAAIMLKEGGRLVYSTCTFAESENEEGIAKFLQRHPEFELLEQKRLWPHKLKGEGHFAAKLQKKSDGDYSEKSGSSMSAGGFIKGLAEKDLKEWRAFVKETISEEWIASHEGKYIKYGENLYLVPEDMPGIQGLKVLRPGLQVGSMKKDRFEPSHALALALSPSDVKNYYSFSLEDRMAKAFINGETFSAQGEKGWYLVCVEGFSMGFGKLAGGIMKNHYPKGLRKSL